MIILKCVSQLLDFIRHVTYLSIFRFMDTLREFEFRQQIHIMTSNYVIVAQLSYAEMMDIMSTLFYVILVAVSWAVLKLNV